MSLPFRAWRLFRGTRTQTRDAALGLLAQHRPEDALWVSEVDRGPFEVCGAREAKRYLGAGKPAVVLDLHDGPDADLLGQVHGMVWAGGILVLRVPACWPGSTFLAVSPYQPEHVGRRFAARLDRGFPETQGPEVWPVARPVLGGSSEQSALVARLVSRWAEGKTTTVLLADRGRGKSATLGLALRQSALPAVVTGPSARAVQEVLRFAPEHRFVELAHLLEHPDPAIRLIVVDEAAQLPVPTLQRLVQNYPDVSWAFATTTQGYEGTGRGFVLRFLAWLSEQRAVVQERLTDPIRWAAHDPLEARVNAALALAAKPAKGGRQGTLETVRLDREELAQDEAQLQAVFGLLVHAHYRTTPSDLHRLLDAPNLSVHVARRGGKVVGATLVAAEGSLEPSLCEAMASGRTRIRGHALADTLICHAGHPEAGPFPMVRSMRIATHPEQRRCGIARALVEHVHTWHRPALFGTVFGATPGLLQFRRAMGYQVVRVGISRGGRTGEPSVTMLRPCTDAAHALLQTLRAELARDLPLQLQFLEAEAPVDEALKFALLADLPSPAGLAEPELDRLVRSYSHGPRPFDTVAFALSTYAERHGAVLADLDPADRRLIEGRVSVIPWRELKRRAGLDTVNAVMRALRRAFRRFVDRVDGL